MVNPVDKLRKQQQKKLLLKQKKERQERNRNKFKNQSRGDVQSELDKLQRKPKSMVNAKDEQKMKSLERLLEEKKDDDDKNAAANIGPTIKGPKDIGVGVTYDDYVGDAARAAVGDALDEQVEELREARVAQRRLALRPPPLLDAREAVQRGDHVHRVHRLGVARARPR